MFAVDPSNAVEGVVGQVSRRRSRRGSGLEVGVQAGDDASTGARPPVAFPKSKLAGAVA